MTNPTGVFSASERRFLAGIAFLLGLRQLALLLVLPFIAVYGMTLRHSTPALIGLSLGIYGLLQGLLQIPFGRWSDRLGRKNMILGGTLLLVAGLALAAVATDIYTFVAARALQGVGAVTAVAYAWIADATAPERRNRAMGIVGLATGLAAIVSFVGGPLLYRFLTLPQIFLICAGLAGLVWLYLLFGIPAHSAHATQAAAPLAPLLNDKRLRLFIAAGFLLNFILMNFVFVLPLLADEAFGARHLWRVLIPATAVGVLAMRLAVRQADAGRFERVAAAAFAVFLPSALCLVIGGSYVIAFATAFFMAGYFALTALLPAGAMRAVEPEARGGASGAFQCAQFLGAFSGGVSSGLLWQLHPGAALGALIVAAGAGLLIALRLPSEDRNHIHAGPVAHQA